jgi:hypothetical protein
MSINPSKNSNPTKNLEIKGATPQLKSPVSVRLISKGKVLNNLLYPEYKKIIPNTILKTKNKYLIINSFILNIKKKTPNK